MVPVCQEVHILKEDLLPPVPLSNFLDTVSGEMGVWGRATHEDNRDKSYPTGGNRSSSLTYLLANHILLKCEFPFPTVFPLYNLKKEKVYVRF